ncbi:hypothetical protein RHMOL_Rhmol03G0158900 [Rhododendron molle]|uniref:Uncharacterized protein n=1 Tax=Rhododendron molle TaxID=49168 RepID=A0ACC0PEQ3_RHOML|nr:hypothetical protein RHMOL_Rhmol03G0158900 [Rhododendron molle]
MVTEVAGGGDGGGGHRWWWCWPVWIWELFPMFRHARDPACTDDLPLAARWLSRRETTMETIYHYHGMLDNLHPSQVVFQPYTDQRQVVADVVFYTGCIRAMAVLEPYLPDTVLRQFRMVQMVPGPPLVPLRDELYPILTNNE